MSTATAPARTSGEGVRARRAVSAVAPLALLASVAGVVLAAVAPADGTTPPHVAGIVLMAAGVLAGAGCLWHGARHHHERGRWFAVAAVLVGLGIGLLVLWDGRLVIAPGRVR